MSPQYQSKIDLTALTVGGIAPSFVSVEHAAQLMDCSHWTIRRWITSGQLVARKMPSGGLRIAVADLEQVGEPVRPDKHPKKPAA
ncbi:helix-turn-helix domain-containing protein [Mycolicibacterium mageritense]|uniref:helix-turn-helix domain-containing protein n=1 Tax=Mycolicibacterium mageritense TaxID=53462 RepID=UPI0011D74E7C|nr:helix-turn-helix domain-containing protein [Mycolicibacterium mageritense]TXI62499.1 MAG: DNA-binding protein [Mycolicibacterium mageritense]